ncbi:MAG TPA: FAD-dependent oxidoreductase [archaeon]|nr:FAD-dependent oxidoreductase [archaeon]
MAEKDIYDVIIIGGGAAGMTAAIYTARKLMKTLVISVDIGGQNLLTEHEENYPGYTALSGPKLMQIFYEQALNFGADFVMGMASKVDKIKEDHLKVTISSGETYESKTLILSFGKIPKKLGIPGEDKFIGRGVHTCATCDSTLMKNRTVAVVGGGNSALEAAELLSKFATKVYLIHRRDSFKGDEITQENLKKAKNIEFVLNSAPMEVLGDEKVKGLLVEDVNSKDKREIKLDSIFVEIGYEVKTDFVRHLVHLNEKNEIVTNELAETSHKGIFAAGDITNKPYKQTVTAAGEGAAAGLSAYNYMLRKEGKEGVRADWG